MTDSSPLVCVVGSANVDTTLRVRTLPAAGETCLASSRRTSHGGKGANQAAAAAALGANVCLVAALGHDDSADEVRRDLAGRGVDVSEVQVVEGVGTGAALILVADDGENVIVVDPAANAHLGAGHVRRVVSERRPAVVLAQLEIPLDAVRAAAETKGAATFVLNPAPMPDQPQRLGPLLELVDVLVPNRTELAALVGRPVPASDDEVAACAEALGFHGVLVVTLGGDGVVVYADRGRSCLARIPAVPVRAVDTSGAGDAFAGSLAHGLARGRPVAESARAANEVAALSTTHHGARLPADVELPRG